MREILETLTLFWPALVASVAVAVACATVGVHVVSRRLVVVGVALPQAAAFGIALSFLFEGRLLLGNHDVAALLCEGGAVVLLAWTGRRAPDRQDLVAGALYAGAAAGTILLVQFGSGGLEEIRHLVEGNVLAVHAVNLPAVGAATLGVAGLNLVLLRPLLLVTFDREFAATLGVRTALWDAVFFAGLALVTATGVHATGVLFVFGYLVLPAAAGIALGRTARSVFAIAATLAVASAALGFVISIRMDTPTGPTCTATALCALVAALALRRR